MKTETKCSPTPWHQGPHYKADIYCTWGQVATCVPLMSPLSEANAAFIVKAANAHDNLITALETIEDICMSNPQEVRRLVRAVLKKAKESSMLDCKCKVEIDQVIVKPRQVYSHIDYCPKHGAVDELIAALERLVDHDHTFFEGKVITGITYDDIQFARAALEKVKS